MDNVEVPDLNPHQRLSVTLDLDAQTWNDALALMRHWPYHIAVKIITQAAPQLAAASQAGTATE